MPQFDWANNENHFENSSFERERERGETRERKREKRLKKKKCWFRKMTSRHAKQSAGMGHWSLFHSIWLEIQWHDRTVGWLKTEKKHKNESFFSFWPTGRLLTHERTRNNLSVLGLLVSRPVFRMKSLFEIGFLPFRLSNQSVGCEEIETHTDTLTLAAFSQFQMSTIIGMTVRRTVLWSVRYAFFGSVFRLGHLSPELCRQSVSVRHQQFRNWVHSINRSIKMCQCHIHREMHSIAFAQSNVAGN